MIEPGAFYGGAAASSAAIFGVGAAVLATRLASLAERASALKLEHGDLLNKLSSRAQDEWARRARRDALADLHEVAGRYHLTVGWPLITAILLVCFSLMPLIGWPADARWYRIVLLVAFAIAGLVWILLLHELLLDLRATTRSYANERRREREAKTAAGASYLESGDPKKLQQNWMEALDRFGPPNPTRKQRRARRRLEKVFKRYRPPRV